MKDFILLTGTSNPTLATKIATTLKVPVYNPVSTFADGEIRVKLPESVRQKHVFIIQSTCPPVNDNLMQVFFMIDAAKRASCGEISIILPYFGYARQDRKDAPRVPISSSVVSKLLEHLGPNRIITVDIHSDQQQGFVSIPWDNLYASYALLPYLKSLKLSNLVVVSPDKGGTSRANAYAKRLNTDGLAVVYKERDTNVKNESKALDMIGNVENKNVLIIDDIVDTAGTMCNAAILLKSRGAKKIIVAATHGLFSPPAFDRLNAAPIDKVVVTDSISFPTPQANPKIAVVSLAKLLSQVILRTLTGGSLNSELID